MMNRTVRISEFTPGETYIRGGGGRGEEKRDYEGACDKEDLIQPES